MVKGLAVAMLVFCGYRTVGCPKKRLITIIDSVGWMTPLGTIPRTYPCRRSAGVREAPCFILAQRR